MSSWTNERGGAARATLVGRSREGGAGARARLPLRGVALPLERDDKLLDLLLDLRLRARFHLRLFPLQVVFAFQRSQLPSEFEDRWGVHSVAERRTARDCPRTNVALPNTHPPSPLASPFNAPRHGREHLRAQRILKLSKLNPFFLHL